MDLSFTLASPDFHLPCLLPLRGIDVLGPGLDFPPGSDLRLPGMGTRRPQIRSHGKLGHQLANLICGNRFLIFEAKNLPFDGASINDLRTDAGTPK